MEHFVCMKSNRTSSSFLEKQIGVNRTRKKSNNNNNKNNKRKSAKGREKRGSECASVWENEKVKERNHVQTFCIFYGFVKQNSQPWDISLDTLTTNLAHNFSMAIKLMFNSQTCLIRLGQLLILFSEFCNSSSDLIRPLVVLTFSAFEFNFI